MTKNLQSQWRAKFYELLTNLLSFSFCSLFVDPLYSYVYYVSIALCLPPTPTSKFSIDYCFQILLGGMCIQKDMKTIPYAKFAGSAECIMGDSKIVGGKEVRAHPLHLVLIILLYGVMRFFWPRTDESSGVENTSYVHASERPHSD